MEPYETWRLRILKFPDPYLQSLPESYLQALYEHTKDPHDKVKSDIWYAEWVKLEHLKKKQIKYCHTVYDLIHCGILNLKDKLKSINTNGHLD